MPKPTENTFKSRLKNGATLIGLWLTLADPYCAEICAGAGFDWVLIDGEHAPNDLRSVLGQLQAVAPYGTEAVARPPVGATHLIKQLLDIGVRTLLIPMIETAAQAADMVKAVRYPPRGVRGVGSAIARVSRWNRIPGYVQAADESICLLVQVESAKALANLAEILAVPGIDGVFIGPADLSASLGHLDAPNHPDVQAAIYHAIDRNRHAGKAPGILTSDETMARAYIATGCRFVAVGVDATLLARGTERLVQSFRESTGPISPATQSGGVY